MPSVALIARKQTTNTGGRHMAYLAGVSICRPGNASKAHALNVKPHKS